MADGLRTSTGRIYVDRADAGRRLADSLGHLRRRDVVVLGLPHGGVPVAAEVAIALGAPLDVIVVRKLGLPAQPEVAMGALGESNLEVLDPLLIAHAHLDVEEVRAVERRERRELEQRVYRFRNGRPAVDLHGRIALVVDDGIATGATARVACRVARHRGADRVILAVPVGPVGATRAVPEADEIVCLYTPQPFTAVGYCYRDFKQTTDDQVVALLDASSERGESR